MFAVVFAKCSHCEHCIGIVVSLSSPTSSTINSGCCRLCLSPSDNLLPPSEFCGTLSEVACFVGRTPGVLF